MGWKEQPDEKTRCGSHQAPSVCSMSPPQAVLVLRWRVVRVTAGEGGVEVAVRRLRYCQQGGGQAKYISQLQKSFKFFFARPGEGGGEP